MLFTYTAILSRNEVYDCSYTIRPVGSVLRSNATLPSNCLGPEYSSFPSDPASSVALLLTPVAFRESLEHYEVFPRCFRAGNHFVQRLPAESPCFPSSLQLSPLHHTHSSSFRSFLLSLLAHLCISPSRCLS